MTDREAWIEEFHAIMDTASTGERRFKACPWEAEKLCWTHIREGMNQLAEQMIEFAKTRHDGDPMGEQDEYLNLIMDRMNDNDHELAS